MDSLSGLLTYLTFGLFCAAAVFSSPALLTVAIVMTFVTIGVSAFIVSRD